MKNEGTLQNLGDFDNKSLLIVDDDNPFRERLARAMEKKGFEVIQAEGVKKGIDAVKTNKPAFAVVDLRLGDGNGLEVVKEIQNSNNVLFVKSQKPIPESKIETYGFGLKFEDRIGREAIHHDGVTLGYHSQTIRFPNEKLTIFILSNNGNIRSDLMANEIANILLNE